MRQRLLITARCMASSLSVQRRLVLGFGSVRFGKISPQTKLTAFCDLLIRMIALVGHNFGNGGIDSRSLKISLSFSHRFNQCVLICLRAVHDDRRQDDFRLKIHGMFRLHTQPGAPGTSQPIHAKPHHQFSPPPRMILPTKSLVSYGCRRSFSGCNRCPRNPSTNRVLVRQLPFHLDH